MSNSELYFDVEDHRWPIIYSPGYNITCLGLEKLHPFDSAKWGRIFEFLRESGMVDESTIVAPREPTQEQLLKVHTKRYLDSLKWSFKVASITEVPVAAFCPNFIVNRRVLRPLRLQMGGTVLGGKLAMEQKWAINLGGGFHHCSSDNGGGFCAYADITLSIRYLFEKYPQIKKVIIIDLDAHQGNGHERDFMEDPKVFILDIYNRRIYPHDGFAKRAITRRVELDYYVQDAEYLANVEKNVSRALDEFQPDFILYNAGTDILDGDPLGGLAISPEGIIKRDEIVFSQARTRDIPILMVTSGGYQRNNARIIADSIINLWRKELIKCEKAEEFLQQRQRVNSDSDADAVKKKSKSK